jgi:hypothetical protein
MEIGDQLKLSYTAESKRLYDDNTEKQDFGGDYLKQSLSPYENFLYALKSPDAKRQYPSLLNKFLTFLAIQGNMDEKCFKLLSIAKKDPDLFQSNLMRYCSFQKDRIQKGEITDGTMRNYIKAIKLFCEMNEIHIFWKKITKGLSAPAQSSDDRPPTRDEISKLITGYPDMRLKVIVLTMTSSGIRIGAWNYLKWKHVEPLYSEDGSITTVNTEDKGSLVAAKISVYQGTRDRYYSFITPEAYFCIQDWMNFRQLHGENINGESWIMRDTWQKLNRNHGHRIGMAKIPRQFHSEGIRSLLERAWKVQGIREKLDVNNRHHDFKSSHGFRKFFQTTCEQVMISANVEKLMGHSNGLKDSYYKPTENEVLKDYLKVVNSLTITEELRLKIRLTELDEENKSNDQFIQKKFDERDEQITRLVQKHQSDMEKLQKETESKLEIKFKQLISKLDLEKIISI